MCHKNLINFIFIVMFQMKKNCRLKFFPISFFAIILWLWWFVLVLQKIEKFGYIKNFSTPFLWFTISTFVVLFSIYLLKVIFYFDEVKNEANNPIKINFFPTIPKWLLILSIAFLGINLFVAKYLWIIWASINLIMTLWIFVSYINKSFEIKHINPAWFIPIVTNIVVPITWVIVMPELLEISWLFFSIWLVFWLMLFFIFFYRIIFHHPLSDKLLPTMAILIAPPSIWFISYVKLTWEINEFAMILFYLAVFLFLLILSDIKKFFKIKFYLSWWAYSFPMAAFTLANVLMFHETGKIFWKYSAVTLWWFLWMIILLLLYKTVLNIVAKNICIEED